MNLDSADKFNQGVKDAKTAAQVIKLYKEMQANIKNMTPEEQKKIKKAGEVAKKIYQIILE